jgi:hypothetical protein
VRLDSTVVLTVIGLLLGLDLDAAAVRTASRVSCPRATGRGVGRTDAAGLQLAPRLPARIHRPARPGGRNPDCHPHRRRGLVPFAAPALWMGMGGAAASKVSTIQLLLPLPVAALAVVVTLSDTSLCWASRG